MRRPLRVGALSGLKAGEKKGERDDGRGVREEKGSKKSGDIFGGDRDDGRGNGLDTVFWICHALNQLVASTLFSAE